MTTIVPPMTIDLPLPGVTFITGPSGAGKSTLLRLISEACHSRGVRVLTMHDAAPAPAPHAASHADPHAASHVAIDRPIIDLVAADQPQQHAMELLSLVGLGDAFVMLRSAAELSDGQRFRLHIALLLAMTKAAAEPTLIAIDEFAATLDRVTARSLAGNIRRWSNRAAEKGGGKGGGGGGGGGGAFLLATTHDDLLESLQPDLLIHKSLGDAIDVVPAPLARGAALVSCHVDGDGDDDGFCIESGTLDDFRALAAFHYRSHHPGAATSVLRIMQPARTSVVGRYLHRRSEERVLVGVLVRSLPALACGLRDRAMRNRYATLSQRERGIVLNREIRCISRVVIEPRFRGLGLAVRLVRFALEHPERDTLIATEALAAMGRVSPFFERAGMRKYEHAPSARQAYERYEAALRTAGLSPMDSIPPANRAASELLMREARRFLRATRRLKCETLDAMTAEQLLAQARTRLLLQPAYYLFVHGGRGRGRTSVVSDR